MKRRQGPKFSRKTIDFARTSGAEAPSDPWRSLYGHMFLEDIHYKVIPIGGKSAQHPDFKIELEPTDPEDERVIRYALPQDGYIDYTLTETVCKFVQHCALQLGYKGKSNFEIALGVANTDDAPLQGYQPPVDEARIFRLEPIRGRIFEIGPYWIQFVPPKYWRKDERVYSKLLAADVWNLALPAELGGAYRQAQILRELVSSSNLTPAFVKDALSGTDKWYGFDFGYFNTLQDVAIARETSNWGWPGRLLWQNRTSEYFQLYRHVRFALALAKLREHIIDELNKLLSRRSFPSRLIMSGLPTAKDVQNILLQIESGKMSFQDAWNSVLFN